MLGDELRSMVKAQRLKKEADEENIFEAIWENFKKEATNRAIAGNEDWVFDVLPFFVDRFIKKCQAENIIVVKVGIPTEGGPGSMTYITVSWPIES